jgi:hypothetical protein
LIAFFDPLQFFTVRTRLTLFRIGYEKLKVKLTNVVTVVADRPNLLLVHSAFDRQDCPPDHYWGDLAQDLLCDGVLEP